MRDNRIKKAIEIIDYAILNNLSVREASVKYGYSNTYVKNVKAFVYKKNKFGELTEKIFNDFTNAYERYSGIKESNKQNQILSNQPSGLPATSNSEKTLYVENHTDASLTWQSSSNYPVDHIKTLDELLTVTKVDLNTWKVKDYLVNKWDVTSWKSGEPETVQNFQVKARLEKNIKILREKAIGELFIETTKNYVPPIYSIPQKPTSPNEENNLFEITIFDLHVGKLAWRGETGENYDTKIARERFLSTIKTLIERASGFNYSKILFPVGNDFFNSDNINNTTTKGTPQDEDLRWQKTFNVGVNLLVDAINLLKQTGVSVDVLVIPGNHDFERSYYMGAYLSAWFNNDPVVKINNGASPRKYYSFGKVLLGFTHGSEEKETSLPLLMATDIESKPMWSDTKYHEWHLGHIHRKRDMKYTILDKARITNEDLGVTIRYLSSLTGTEEWHHKKGFVGAIKAGEAFIWNDEAGLIAHLNSNLII